MIEIDFKKLQMKHCVINALILRRLILRVLYRTFRFFINCMYNIKITRYATEAYILRRLQITLI